MTASAQQLLDRLADERDRLVEEVDGLRIAISSSCVASVISGLLLPGIGVVVSLTAMAACRLGNTDDFERRIGVQMGLVERIERLADRVSLVDENDAAGMARVESEVLQVLDLVRNVSILDDVFDDAVAGALGFIDSLGGVLNTLSNMATAAAAVAAVVVGYVFLSKR